MSAFLSNILLALAWVAMTGQFSPANLALGFLIGYLLLRFTQNFAGPAKYFRRVRLVLSFAVFVLWELLRASLVLALDVVTPRHRMLPIIVAVPLDARTDAEITLLANLITLTPGSLVLDVSSDRRVLYVHAMYSADAEATRREIKEGFERRVLELLR